MPNDVQCRDWNTFPAFLISVGSYHTANKDNNAKSHGTWPTAGPYYGSGNARVANRAYNTSTLK